MSQPVSLLTVTEDSNLKQPAELLTCAQRPPLPLLTTAVSPKNTLILIVFSFSNFLFESSYPRAEGIWWETVHAGAVMLLSVCLTDVTKSQLWSVFLSVVRAAFL
jgi:hypothetical protein